MSTQIDKEYCEECGASTARYKQILSKGIVVPLLKMANKVKQTNLNDIRISKDLELTKSEYNNFQKLRYFGLIAKVKIDGNVNKGRWLITARGWAFLDGKEAVHNYVVTYRNIIEERSEEKVMIQDVLGNKLDNPYFQNNFNI